MAKSGRAPKPPVVPRVKDPLPRMAVPGGGTNSGSLNIGGMQVNPTEFRGAVREARDAKTNLTVSGALYEDMAALDFQKVDKKTGKLNANAAQFLESLDRLSIENERSPGENLLEPYRQAFNQLATEKPVQAEALLDAIEAPLPHELRDQTPAEALESNIARRKGLSLGLLEEKFDADSLQQRVQSLPPEDAAALRDAQELSSVIQTGRQMGMAQEPDVDVEGVRAPGLMEDMPVFDETRRGESLVRALARAEIDNPAIEGLVDAGTAYAPAPQDPRPMATRGDGPFSLRSLMGSKDEAKPFYYEDRPPSPSTIFYPIIKPVHQIRLLSELSGRPFTESIAPQSSTVGSLTKGRVGPSAEGSVGDFYQTDMGQDPVVAKALRMIDRNAKLNKSYGLDPESPAVVNEAIRLQIDPQELVTMPMTYGESLPHRIRQLMGRPDAPEGGRIMLRYGANPINSPAVERKIMRELRSPLAKWRDSLFSVLDGTQRSPPRQLQNLVPTDRSVMAIPPDEILAQAGFTDEQLAGLSPAQIQETVDSLRQRTMNQSAYRDDLLSRGMRDGGVIDLEGMSPYYAAHFQYMDPVDLQRYQGPLPPEILSHTIAQQLLLDDPNVPQTMMDPLRRSMNIYQQFPYHGRVLKKFIEPDGQPALFEPSKAYREQTKRFLDRLGVPVPDIGDEKIWPQGLIPRPDPLTRPSMDDFGMTADPFSQRMGLLSALIG